LQKISAVNDINLLFVQFLTPSSFLPLKIQGKDAFKRSAEGRIGFLKVKDKGYFKIRNHEKNYYFSNAIALRSN
jgi:hypothetical protein